MANKLKVGDAFSYDEGRAAFVIIGDPDEHGRWPVAYRHLNIVGWEHSMVSGWHTEHHPDPDAVWAEYTAWRLLNA